MKRFVAVILLVIMVSTFSVAGALIQSPFPIDETLDIVTPVTDEILEKYGDFIEYAKKEVIYDGKEIPVNLKKVQSCLIVPNEKTKLYTSDGYDWDLRTGYQLAPPVFNYQIGFVDLIIFNIILQKISAKVNVRYASLT